MIPAGAAAAEEEEKRDEQPPHLEVLPDPLAAARLTFMRPVLKLPSGNI
jgi:hypothetical protein